MEEIKKRFKYCDPGFFPYLEKLLDRLPRDVKEDLIVNEGFQILAGDAFHDMCTLRYMFDDPVDTVVYLNTKILKEPEHRIILTLACEIATLIAQRKKVEPVKKEVEDLLINWGFAREIDSVRLNQAIASSEGYQLGYKWAIKQNKDYLMQHFGLYFDEWNKTGWEKKPGEILKMIDREAGKASILDDLTQFREMKPMDTDRKAKKTAPSLRQAILAGIMTAVKEIELLEQYSAQKCEVRI